MTSKISKFFKSGKWSEKIPEDGDTAVNDGPINIGEPFNVVRNYHVNWDLGKQEFIGLPPAWKNLLDANIS